MKIRGSDHRVIMVGPDTAGRGGVSTVVRNYREAGLFDNGACLYVQTHTSGSVAKKLRLAIIAYLRVLRLLLTRRADLFHIHVTTRMSFWRKLPIFCLAKLFLRPVVLHLHAGEFMVFYGEESGPTRQAVIRKIFEIVDVALVLSPEWQDLIRGIAPQANIEVLTNGLRIPTDYQVRRPDERKVVLFLGRLSRRKGIFDLIEVVDKLRQRVPNILLVAAGNGQVERVKAEVRRLGLSDYVDVPGWVDRQEKQALLIRASVFSLPSYYEGLPMSLLEAMAASLPVVCSSVGGIPAAITHGRDGLLIEPGDQNALYSELETVLTNPELSATLAWGAYRRVRKEFDIDRKIEYLLDLYCRLDSG